MWFPPEMRADEIRDKSYYPFESTRCNGEDDPDCLENHAYTTRGNNFVAGFVMYQFITLDEPDTMSHYLSRIMRREETEPLSTLLDVDEIEARGQWLRQNDGDFTNMTPAKQVCYDRSLDIYNMLLRWSNHRSRLPALTRLVERCMAFKLEDRIDAHDLLLRIEANIPPKLAQLNTLSPAAIATATRIFTKPADLGEMRRGNADVEPPDAEFWDTLIRAYKWLDPSDPVIRPDVMGEDVTAEAFDFFSPGRREARNRAAAVRERGERG